MTYIISIALACLLMRIVYGVAEAVAILCEDSKSKVFQNTLTDKVFQNTLTDSKGA